MIFKLLSTFIIFVGAIKNTTQSPGYLTTHGDGQATTHFFTGSTTTVQPADTTQASKLHTTVYDTTLVPSALKTTTHTPLGELPTSTNLIATMIPQPNTTAVAPLQVIKKVEEMSVEQKVGLFMAGALAMAGVCGCGYGVVSISKKCKKNGCKKTLCPCACLCACPCKHKKKDVGVEGEGETHYMPEYFDKTLPTNTATPRRSVVLPLPAPTAPQNPEIELQVDKKTSTQPGQNNNVLRQNTMRTKELTVPRLVLEKEPSDESSTEISNSPLKLEPWTSTF